MYKKIISLLLTFLLICTFFAGCNPDQQPGEDVPDGTNPSYADAKEAISVGSAYLNYFYIDAITSQYAKWNNTYGESTSQYLTGYLGLNPSVSLDVQYYNTENEITWADYFLAVATDNAQTAYAMYHQAQKDNYVLSADAQEKYNSWIQSYESQAKLTNTTEDEIAIQNYGTNASFETFQKYLDIIITAQDYTVNYANSLTYDPMDLPDYEFGREKEFNSYSYAFYYIGYNQYPHLGTTDEEGITTYSDDQKIAALKAAKENAESLLAADSMDTFDRMISQLDCNDEEENIASVKNTRVSFNDIDTLLRGWICDESRKPGDTTVIADSVTATDENGDTVTAISGYYVLFFRDMSDNIVPLSNVRHIYVACQGGTSYPDGEILYSDAEMDAAKAEAEKLLKTWEKKPTQEHFISLAQENTDDTASKESGGLYENISPFDSYVPSFLDWVTDEKRQPGDTDVIQGEGGYHVMYYVGASELNYRETLILQALRDEDYNSWCSDVTEKYELTFEDADLLDRNLILTTLFQE